MIRRPVVRMDAYETNRTGSRTADWDRIAYGPNRALDHLDAGRARSQDAARNNPWLRKAIKLLVSHLVGCGMQPRPLPPDPAFRQPLLDLWTTWTAEADADGAVDFAGLQTLLVRARVETGECFLRLRVRRPGDGLSVPLQLQALEADLLPLQYNNPARTIRQGIERDAIGRRVAYWFHREHPGDALLWRNEDLRRVPAAEVLHYYQPERPGQLRGAPETLSTLLRARNLDHYESAELTRKKLKARFSGAIYKETPEENPLTDAPANPVLDDLRSQLAAAELHPEDPDQVALAAQLRERILIEQERKTFVDVEEGYLLQLAPHERIDLFSGDTGNDALELFLRSQLRAIAAGIGVPYELLTGDYTGTNDRVMRVVLNAFYRDLEAQQDHLVAQILQPIWNRWLDLVYLSDALSMPGYGDDPRPWRRVEWRAHAWRYVNPLQEVQTSILKIQNGLSSRSAEIAESGWDAEDVDRQQAADRVREIDLGLTYGGDTPVAREGSSPTPDIQEAPA